MYLYKNNVGLVAKSKYYPDVAYMRNNGLI